jgi:hypothetical protein
VLAKPARGDAPLRLHANSQERVGSGIVSVGGIRIVGDSPVKAVAHVAPRCLALTVFGRHALVGGGRSPVILVNEKCRSVLGAKSQIRPAPARGLI